MIRFSAYTIVMATVIAAFSITAFADGGKPVDDQNLFNSIRDRYNGEWMGEMSGTASAEKLKDNSILIELSDRFAEFAFYNTPQAWEEIQYIPPSGGAGWLNYFDRNGSSIRCGESSYDLKNNPFQAFKCRFDVDAEGTVVSFTDRSATTSNAKPGGEEGWEKGTEDFHWRSVDAMSGQANAYSDSNVRRDTSGRESFHLQLFGDVAKALYSQLNATSEIHHMGPRFVEHIKYGKQIWCSVPDQGEGAKCRIAFSMNGVSQPPTRN